MIYEILDEKGMVVNRVVADSGFMEKNYPGRYRVVVEAAMAEAAPAPDPFEGLLAKVEEVKKIVVEINDKIKPL